MTDHRSRRWFQLSLKSLFLLTLLVATFFGGYSLATKRAEEAVRAAQEAQTSAEHAMRSAEAATKAEEHARACADELLGSLQADFERMHAMRHDHGARRGEEDERRSEAAARARDQAVNVTMPRISYSLYLDCEREPGVPITRFVAAAGLGAQGRQSA